MLKKNSIEIKTLTLPLMKQYLEAIIEIDSSQMTGFENWTKHNFLLSLDDKFLFSSIVLVDGKVIGYSVASRKKNVLHIHRIAVKKEFTNQKIGSKLLAFIETKARSKKIYALTTEVLNKSNLVDFYIKNNFKILSNLEKDIYSEQKESNIRDKFLKNYDVLSKRLDNITTIHQPYFMPWLGFFDKVAKSDVYIVLDNVLCDYKSKSVLNRNKIKTPQGSMWLSVPIKGGIHQLIKDVKIDYDGNWVEDHLKTLFYNYKKTENFDKIYPLVEKIYQKKHTKLIDLNMEIIALIFDLLKIKPQILFASDIKVDGKNNQLLINLLKSVKATEYISGLGAKDYLDENMFEQNRIKVEWQEFSPPVYNQLWGEFIPNLSALDYLFCDGRPLWPNV